MRLAVRKISGKFLHCQEFQRQLLTLSPNYYFRELFEAEYEYRTIGTYGTVISFYHVLVEEMKIGVQPTVSELMQGVFNARPAQPKYTFIWDVQTVLNFIKRLGK